MDTDNNSTLNTEEIEFLDNLSFAFRQERERSAIYNAVERKFSDTKFGKASKFNHINPFVKISLVVIVFISSVLGVYLSFVKNNNNNAYIEQNRNSSIRNSSNELIRTNDSSPNQININSKDSSLQKNDKQPLKKESKKKKIRRGPIKGLPLKPHEQKKSLPD